MTQAEYVDAVKRKFRITTAGLNSDIEECVEIAVDYLAPYLKKNTTDTSVTVNSTDSEFTLPVAGADLRLVYIKGSDDRWIKYTDYTHHDDYVMLRTLVEDNTSVRLHLSVPFDMSTIEDIPAHAARPVILLACAEFATLLAGDKSRYNIYAQSNGARAVDNMLDMAEYYESRAERQLSRVSSGDSLD